jgi:hypothetical protein
VVLDRGSRVRPWQSDSDCEEFDCEEEAERRAEYVGQTYTEKEAHLEGGKKRTIGDWKKNGMIMTTGKASARSQSSEKCLSILKRVLYLEEVWLPAGCCIFRLKIM